MAPDPYVDYRLDRVVRRMVWVVYRYNHGAWTEIYRTPVEQLARIEAKRMAMWDSPTKVENKIIEVIRDLKG